MEEPQRGGNLFVSRNVGEQSQETILHTEMADVIGITRQRERDKPSRQW
jgi:hypothetical protein